MKKLIIIVLFFAQVCFAQSKTGGATGTSMNCTGGHPNYCAETSIEAEPLSQYPIITINGVSVQGPPLPVQNTPFIDGVFRSRMTRVTDVVDNNYCGKGAGATFLGTFSSTEHHEISSFDTILGEYHFVLVDNGGTPSFFSIKWPSLEVVNDSGFGTEGAPTFCVNNFGGTKFAGDGLTEWFWGNPNEFIAATQKTAATSTVPFVVNTYSFPSGSEINSTGSNLTVAGFAGSNNNPNASYALNGIINANPSYLTEPNCSSCATLTTGSGFPVSQLIYVSVALYDATTSVDGDSWL